MKMDAAEAASGFVEILADSMTTYVSVQELMDDAAISITSNNQTATLALLSTAEGVDYLQDQVFLLNADVGYYADMAGRAVIESGKLTGALGDAAGCSTLWVGH